MRISKKGTETAQILAPVMVKAGVTEEEGVALIRRLGATESQLTTLRKVYKEEAKKWGKADVRNVPGSGTETK